MKKFILITLLLAVALIANSEEYKKPADYLTKIFDTPNSPTLVFAKLSNLAVEINYQRYQTLEQLAEPSIKLAGIELSTRLNSETDKYPIKMITFFDIETQTRRKVELPNSIKIRDFRFNGDYSKLAATHETENGIKLLIIDVQTGNIKYLDNVLINDVFGNSSVAWLDDNKTLLVKTIPARKKLEIKSNIPKSPIIESTAGKKSTLRTYQNLLKNSQDEKLFDYYFTSQLALVNSKNGKLKKIGEPAIYTHVVASPNNKYLLISKINKPYSYQVPHYYFPQTYLVMNMKGKLVKELSNQPLQDLIPIGGIRIEPRSYQWQPLQPASIVWTEALDGGDPKNKVDNRDKIMRLSAPFASEAEELFRTKNRFAGIQWSAIKDELIYYEYNRDKLWLYTYLFNIEDKKAELLFERSNNDNYNDPGDLVTEKTENGFNVFIKKKNKIYLTNNKGASKEGNYPFLAEFDLQTKEQKILFQCQEGYYETIRTFINKDLSKIVIKSENTETWPNYYIVDLNTNNREQITHYQNPYPEIANLSSELIYYTREDSVLLSGKLYLPPNYKKGERLPLILHAYPQEYIDASTAGQVSETANSYPKFSNTSNKYLALEGYAVLENASIPIIGDPETVNDTFIKQLNSSVKAAIDYLAEKEIIDPERVGCIGHSYGAFMVANILANSDLCAVGVAKSGAYNRTLTPFGFQSERRTFWEAKEFYLQVSPFMSADKINEPLLLIHGENDPNPGTFPIQSKRLYHALKGNGGISRLVILPLEGHGYYARKSNLHVLTEIIEWFDKYLKK